MGKCFSCLTPEERGAPEGGSSSTSFQEEERNKSRDGARRRKRSSGLSRFSTDDRHVMEKPFRIAAFNVRRFGVAKMADPTLVDILVRLVQTFDIVVMQEVVDVTGKAVDQLLAAVNLASGGGGDGDTGGQYAVEVSPRLGRNNQKEQYAVFYRRGKAKLEESLVYEDPGDVFIREPFILRFSSEAVAEAVSTFTLVAIHTQPKSAVTEIDHLFAVHQSIREKYSAENIIILGDFNAGGSFVRSQDWTNIRLKGPGFTWLIPDHMDTTATNTLAAYDRIVVWGDNLVKNTVPGSAGVFRYDEEWTIPQETLLKVSDHFPVSFDLRPARHPSIDKNISAKLQLVVQDKRFPAISEESLSDTINIPKYKARTYYDSEGVLTLVELRSHRLRTTADVLKSLEKLRSGLPSWITYSQFATVRYKLETEGIFTPSPEDTTGSYYIVISADILQKKFTCSVEVDTFLS